MVTDEYHTVSLPSYIFGLSVSPNGQIIYSSGSMLYLFDERKGESELTSVNGDLVYPVWSKDGNNVAMAAVQEKAELNVFNVKQNVLTNLTGNSDDEDDPKDWLDNSHILLLSDSPSGMNQLSTIKVDGTDRKVLYKLPYYYVITTARLSPDKKMLVLDVTDASKANRSDFIELFSLTDGTEEVLANIPSGSTYPAWSPDGKYIAYCYEQGIYVYELKTGNIIQLTIPEASYNNLVWAQTVK
jgi:Tol biopolymer transport system component